MKKVLGLSFLLAAFAHAETPILLKPAAVFDGQEIHAGWSVLVSGRQDFRGRR